jgi:hypothetical protein
LFAKGVKGNAVKTHDPRQRNDGSHNVVDEDAVPAQLPDLITNGLDEKGWGGVGFKRRRRQ